MTLDKLDLIYTGSVLLVLWLGWIIKARPKVRGIAQRVSAALDTFGGRAELYDEVSGETLPEILPLHKRLNGIEDAQALQAEALDRLAKVQADQTEIFRITSDHEQRIVSLEDVEAERSLTREESTAVWRAIADRDVIEGETIE